MMYAFLLLLLPLVSIGSGTPFEPRYYQRTKRASVVVSKDINPKWNATWTDKLKRDLLLSYDKFARPNQHNNTTSLTLDLTILHVEVDEMRAILTIHCWVKMTWQDEKLKWNPDEYGGLTQVHLADHEIWQPDVFPYNSATGRTLDHYGNTNCIAQEDGTVLWVPPTIFHVFCDLNFRKWPFDTQVCAVKIGSWTYNGQQLDLRHSQHDAEFESLLPTAEWKLIKIERERHVVIYQCCVEPFVDVTYNITIQRRSPTYKSLVITPATAIVLMTLATFWLPPTSGDKIMLGGATTIVICLFLLYFTQKLSAIAGHTPLIVLFYTSSLYMVTFSLVISVIVINIARNKNPTPLPWIIKNYLTSRLGRLLLLNHAPYQPSAMHHSLTKSSTQDDTSDSQPVFADEQSHDASGSSEKSCQQDWLMLAVAVDRLSFLLYCFLFSVFAMAFSI